MTGVHSSSAVYNFVRYLIKVAGDVDIRLRAHRWGFGVGVTGLGETAPFGACHAYYVMRAPLRFLEH